MANVPNVIVVTGASSGFGHLAAVSLARAGHTVAAGMRQTSARNATAVGALEQLAHDEGLNLAGVEMDVQSQASVDTAINAIIDQHGRLDVVVHNAGHMVLGPAEAFTPDQLAAVYDVNVIGTQRVNRAVLPHLRAQGSGLLVWIGSSSNEAATRPSSPPTSRRKPAWTHSPKATPGSSSDSASTLPSSFLAPSPPAPTTSCTPELRATPNVNAPTTNSTVSSEPASATDSPPLSHPAAMPNPSPTRSSESLTFPAAGDRFAATSIRARTEAKWSPPSLTASATTSITALASRNSCPRTPLSDPRPHNRKEASLAVID